MTPARRAAAALVALACAAPALAQPAGPRVWEARGDSLMAALATGSAVAAYRRGLAEAPADPALLWKAARALSNQAAETPGTAGDEPLHEEAIALARRAVAAGPDVARAHTTLATALGRHGRDLARECRIRCAGRVIDMGKEAYFATRRAIELDPWDPAPFIVLGVYHRELATVPLVVKIVAKTFLGGYPPVSLERSESYLRRAVRLDPRDVTARVELARTYRAMGEDAAARAEARAALAAPVRERLDAVLQAAARRELADAD